MKAFFIIFRAFIEANKIIFLEGDNPSLRSLFFSLDPTIIALCISLLTDTL